MNRERTGERNLAFSQWHRDTFPDDACAFDVDLVGICPRCDQPLYVIETTRSQSFKPTTWTQKVALQLNVPGFLVHYTVDDDDRLAELGAFVLAPFQSRRQIGAAAAFAQHLSELRRHHLKDWHCEPVPPPQPRLFRVNGSTA